MAMNLNRFKKRSFSQDMVERESQDQLREDHDEEIKKVSSENRQSANAPRGNENRTTGASSASAQRQAHPGSHIDAMGNVWPTISGARPGRGNSASSGFRTQDSPGRQPVHTSAGSRGQSPVSGRTQTQPGSARTRTQNGTRERRNEQPEIEEEREIPRSRRSREAQDREIQGREVQGRAVRDRAVRDRTVRDAAFIGEKSSAKDRQSRLFKIYLGAGAAAILLIAAGIFLFTRMRSPSATATGGDTSAGIQYLTALEQKDMTPTLEKIKEIKKQERRDALASGDVSIWSLFYDYVVLGDSRSVGFTFYELLDESRVFAEAGNTIAVVPDRIPQIQPLNPENIFLCYGINDVSIGLYDTPEIYAQEMDKTVMLLQENFPNSHIYVNSIFPAQDPAFESSEKWREIPDYNVAVKAMCEEKGYSYIDNTSVYEEHSDLYDPDGIHFQKALYDYWAINMLAEMDTQDS